MALLPALSPLRVEIPDLVRLSDILVICSFKIRIQGIDYQEAQGQRIFQMSSLSFLYNCDNVIHVIKMIDSTINDKESKFDMYLWTTFHKSPIHCLKGHFKCVLNCTNFPEKKVNGYMSKTDLVLVLTNKRGGKFSHPQFSTQTDWMNKMSAYEAATAWNRRIPHIILKSIIKSFFLSPVFLLYLMYQKVYQR